MERRGRFGDSMIMTRVNDVVSGVPHIKQTVLEVKVARVVVDITLSSAGSISVQRSLCPSGNMQEIIVIRYCTHNVILLEKAT